MTQIKEIEQRIKDLNKKINKEKKEYKNNIKTLDNNSKILKKLKKEFKQRKKTLTKKVAKLNQKLLSFENKNDVRKLYLHSSINRIDNKILIFWSNTQKESDEFKIKETILIDIKHEKFFKDVFNSMLNKIEFDVFIDDKHFTKSINKLIKNYSKIKEYKII